MNHYDTSPTGAEMSLAAQLTTLARSGFGGAPASTEAITKALIDARCRTAEAIEEEVGRLTPLEFAGHTWLRVEQVVEVIRETALLP